jgi:hypothetical protein
MSFTIHVPSLIIVGMYLCINSQITTVAQNILHLNQPSRGRRSLILNCLIFSNVAAGGGGEGGGGTCELFDSHQKFFGEVSLRVQLEPETVRIF